MVASLWEGLNFKGLKCTEKSSHPGQDQRRHHRHFLLGSPGAALGGGPWRCRVTAPPPGEQSLHVSQVRVPARSPSSLSFDTDLLAPSVGVGILDPIVLCPL